MASIGEQIIAARKAKGMTQDALSKALNISRSAVAHWETGRTIPDAEMLLKLSKALDYSFENEAAKAPESIVLPTDSATEAPQTGDTASQTANKPTRRKQVVIIVAAVVLLCACLTALLIHNNRKKPVTFKAENGSVYTVEQFRQDTPREDGKAWLSKEYIVKTQSGDGADMWMYEFLFHEMNGIGFNIDRLEIYTFAGDVVHPQILSSEQLAAYEIATRVEPHGDWSFTGGLPVQEKVAGVGMVLTGTDDNGESLSFSNYLELHA